MATLFHMDVLRLTSETDYNGQYVEIIGTGTLTTQEDPEGSTYPLPTELHPLIVAIADNLHHADTVDHDGVRRFFFRKWNSSEIRLIIQIQPYFDYLTGQQQNPQAGVLCGYDAGVQLRISNGGVILNFANLDFVRTFGRDIDGVSRFVLNEAEIDATIKALTRIKHGEPVDAFNLIKDDLWRVKLNELAEERVGCSYATFSQRRGEVAA